MDLMTRAEFEELVGESGATKLSLFAPTHRVATARESDEDRLRWKNLLTTVQDTLVAEGAERREVEEMLAPAWELHGDAMAWSHMGDGLAMFLRPGWSASYRVPLEVPELAAYGDGFILSPVLPLLSDQNYVVLALSQKAVRVLRGSRDRIGELDVPGVPEAFGEVYDEGRQPDSVPRASTTGRGGQAVFHGPGGMDNLHKEDVVEFFRMVARGVEEHLAGRSIPLILAGLPEWVAVYRELNGYPHLVDAAIERNPDDMSADDLRAAAWELVSERLEAETSRLLDRLNEQRAHGTGVVDPHETLTAAREGRVDTLLLTADGCYGPSHDGRVVVLPSDGDGDVCALADAAARATLRNGGAVRVVAELPEDATVGAVLRY